MRFDDEAKFSLIQADQIKQDIIQFKQQVLDRSLQDKDLFSQQQFNSRRQLEFDESDEVQRAQQIGACNSLPPEKHLEHSAQSHHISLLQAEI